jgi:D-sedoheptulose 7-phosphate isomerase
MSAHLDNLLLRKPQLQACRQELLQAFTALRDVLRSGGKLLLCGNGGSAADAEHWAGEMLKGFCSNRTLNEKERATLPPELGDKLQGALPVIPLTGFLSLSTAIANDVDPALTFAQLVWALGAPGDALIGISTSGNARNVCLAMHTARARKLVTFGLTGQSGGELCSLVDHCIRAPETDTYLVQELHLPIFHCLSLMLEEEFFGSN